MNDILADWADVVDRAVPGPRSPDVLTVELDGWEGPLDLLLALARTQKVDLRELSILALVEQYLAFRSEERRVGKDCVSMCGSRWPPEHYIQNKTRVISNG